MYYQGSVLCIDLITTQIFKFATAISCNNNPQNVIALDLYYAERYVLTPKFALRATPTLIELKQLESATSSNTSTAQDAGIYSKAELTKFCNRVFFH